MSKPFFQDQDFEPQYQAIFLVLEESQDQDPRSTSLVNSALDH